MYERLVRSRRGSACLYVGPVAAVGLFGGSICTIPWTFVGPRHVLPWVDVHVMLVAGIASAIGLGGFIVVLIGRILIGLGLFGALYGRVTEQGVVLAKVAGRTGLPWTQSQTIELMRGQPATIRAYGDPPLAGIMQLQGLVITQGDSELLLVCFIGFSTDSRAVLGDWLERHGITAEITGDEEVLPLGPVPAK
ncbi:MAG: hypothetical protein HGA44_10070 [Cellulomonadaceae bacterium]|nr:hypothetical protein [Cellulomonadaceae bacterium]